MTERTNEVRNTNMNEVAENEMVNVTGTEVTDAITTIKCGDNDWQLPSDDWSLEDVIIAAKQLTANTSTPIKDDTPYTISNGVITFDIPQVQNYGTKGNGTDDPDAVDTEGEEVVSSITTIKCGDNDWQLPSDDWSLEDVIIAAKQLTANTSTPIKDDTPYTISNGVITFDIPQVQNYGTKGNGTDDPDAVDTEGEEVTDAITTIKCGDNDWQLPSDDWSLEDVIIAAKQLTANTSTPIKDDTPYTISNGVITFDIPQVQNYGTKGRFF